MGSPEQTGAAVDPALARFQRELRDAFEREVGEVIGENDALKEKLASFRQALHLARIHVSELEGKLFIARRRIRELEMRVTETRDA